MPDKDGLQRDISGCGNNGLAPRVTLPLPPSVCSETR